jgi:branched-chain amino acid transport system substrate-binding protein
VTLARYDDRGEVALAQEHARSVAYDQDVIGVVGSFTNPVTEELAKALTESGLAMVAPLALAEDLTAADRPHVNQLLASNTRMGAQAAAYARHRLGSRSIMLLLDGSLGADRQAASFETAAQIVTLPVVGRVSLPSAVDAASLAKAVQASGADAVYYAGNSKTGFEVAQALRQQGLTLPVIGGPELYSPAFETAENSGMRAIYFAHFTEGTGDRFARHFETILGKPTRGYGMFGYDAARVILEALVTYGEAHPGQAPDRTELATLVRATRDFRGYSSAITFDATTGENQDAKVYIFEWVYGRYELRE